MKPPRRTAKRRAAAARKGAAAEKPPAIDAGDEELSAGWFPIWLIAAAFGITKQGFHDIVRPLVQAADVRGAGQRGTKIRCRGAIDAWVSHKIGIQAVAGGGEDSYLFGGPDSPWLEKLREYKAGQEKIKLEQMRGMLIPREQLSPALGQFAAALRRAGETLQRQYGDDAAELLNEAINEAVGIWEKMLKDQPS